MTTKREGSGKKVKERQRERERKKKTCQTNSINQFNELDQSIERHEKSVDASSLESIT